MTCQHEKEYPSQRKFEREKKTIRKVSGSKYKEKKKGNLSLK